MSHHKNGAVDSSKTVKAGCGIRYDPDVLDEESGFDFSAAQNLKPQDLELPDRKAQVDKSKDSEAKPDE